MEDEVLVTSICTFLEEQEQELLNDRFREELKKSDRLEISVGFCSYESLRELEKLILQMNIKKVCVILGMYYFNGFPEPLHKFTLEMNERWMKAGIGEIRLVHAWKYHVKLYCFFRNNQIFSAIFGSPNLSFLTERPVNHKAQKEMACLIKEPKNSQVFQNI
ncbi:hypothetical protein OVS_00790 [Mycoplasma ovis str. Michigan]|uniref:Restriction endonuclease type II NgoFVII N-terminal domain-containing protein n=1 Tax=Mycoplasma ovis str. Michigan TaxID=1415773 RepID=A0ABN4BRF3_9MOLU|nr:restriction endonuclease PLD domain-containing protein [Mycoplasma ovis]AHC40148.1 hypothetical protein OVS_00790 [Mycoplasma ovis str. Michigan]